MNDPIEPLSSPIPGTAELDQLRLQVAELRGTVRLLLLGLIITTGGLCLFMYRQTKLLRYQVLAQQETVNQAEAAIAPVLQMLPRFQQVGWRFPDYASNVLAQFRLDPLPPSNAPAAIRTNR
ncbi:MAG: hypothetical protein KIT22_18505 [Verrucomicrobiae bacterium]|nr:hypothetical protein [Verrucomicrobiae bacterium]